MNKFLVLRHMGNFYNALDDDVYILHYLLGYKINNFKSGFPKSAYNKVINILEEKNINYIVKSKNECIEQDFKRKNKYNEYVNKGKEKYQKELKMQNLEESIRNLSSEKLEKLYKYIEDLINER